MKREATETDREAAGLFSVAPGMRAGWRGSRNGVSPVWERLLDGTEATPDYLDTDDPATLGCMLAQVRAVHGWASAFTGLYGGQWVACTPFVAYPGVTEGAALVAAMREAKR
jgi:hypothetical protein